MIPVTTTNCLECDRLLSVYEAATFEQARIHNSLDIAQHLRDANATRRLTLEAFDVTERRKSARSALRRHQIEVHEPEAARPVAREREEAGFTVPQVA